jgi:hypothetical protein
MRRKEPMKPFLNYLSQLPKLEVRLPPLHECHTAESAL